MNDLDTHKIPGPVSVTPLTYVGPAALYVNGVFFANIMATTGTHNVTFAVGAIALGDIVTIVDTVAHNRLGMKITSCCSFMLQQEVSFLRSVS
ncbi:MAG TPA: hypothetical protein PKD52_04075 [Clostridiales bacterium]|nr:hypothetical protein [Clostridiales bacterium]